MRRLELVSRDVHRIALAGNDLDFVLLRKRGRRGVGLRVDASGLTVSAPLAVPLTKIEALIRNSERWVTRKIAEWGTKRVPEASWSEGAELPYLGGSLVLRLSTAGRAKVELGAGELHVAVPSREPDVVKRAVVAWYKKAALAHLAQRAFALARLGGITPPRVRLSSAMARWGSCDSHGEVRLTWRLVKAPPELVDYVVCHELAHLRHMDHSRAFWNEVERLCPGHRRLRAALDASDHLYRSF
ncbi:M48 family metallopeptidase [Usitatibacter palustris]|uniref:YgjP-like metallopeptidase domain-containing protein n=1 Tax=Usitatibacter palustris TaxID=2732487 RepID=A0A6M4H6U1_9PROT|nr:SprT family zinc-dependent metalloprotease [Usitatibacter palustris]QJR13677.1 hypothetical protein DSM104440_00463 [Usitatibacter palustris]